MSNIILTIVKNVPMMNTTGEPNASSAGYNLDLSIQVTIVVCHAVNVLASIGGNVLICYIITSSRKMRTITNFFLLSLAISDIIMTAVCTPFTVVADIIFHYWPFGPVLCPAVSYLQVLSVLQRALILITISVDRYLIILQPLRQRLSETKAKLVILVVWMISAVISLPSAMYSKIIYLPQEPGSNGLCVEKWPEMTTKYWYSVSLMILQYFFPLLVLCITYGHMGYIIWIKEPLGEAVEKQETRMSASKRKTIKMLIVVVIAYALCWLPLHTVTLVGDQNPSIYNHKYVHIIWLFCQWLALSNCALNPIIYCWMNPTFRRGFYGVLNTLTCSKFFNGMDRSSSVQSTRYEAISMGNVNKVCRTFSSTTTSIKLRENGCGFVRFPGASDIPQHRL